MKKGIKYYIKKILAPPKNNSDALLSTLENKGLVIGPNTKKSIHSPEGIDALYPWLIEIGDDCVISSNVRILAHDASTKKIMGYTKVGRISIGNRVFIGHGSTILCNTKIGDNVIIGANSLVNHDLESNGVYCGVPAKFLCSIDDYKEKNIHALTSQYVTEKSYIYWRDNASQEERAEMKEKLQNGIGYVR